MSSTPRPTKADRKDAAREKARQMREQAQARQRRTRQLTILAVVVGVLAVVVAVGVLVQSARTTASEASRAPANVTDGAITVGSTDAPATVSVYLDYACPACAQFEAMDGEWLQEKAEAGEIALEYKPISILDRYSTTEFSTRSASAAGCVAEYSPEAFPEFNAAMFANQTAEQGPGMTNEEIWGIAADAGAAPETEQCIVDERFTGWAAATTDAASQAGVRGTPTVVVNGEILQDRSRQAIEEAIVSAS